MLGLQEGFPGAGQESALGEVKPHGCSRLMVAK